MSDCKDFEERLGIKTGKIKMVIPEEKSYSTDLKLTIEKRTSNGYNSLKILIHGKSYNDERVYENIEISWDAVESLIQWLSGGPRKNGNTKSSNDVFTLKRQMKEIRMASSLFKSAFKRLNKTLDEHELESAAEKNDLPKARERNFDF